MSADPDRSPVRIQRRRTPGWRMPDGARYVGRGTRWGNPFRVGDTVDGTVIVDAAAAVELFDLHTGTFGLHEYDRATLAELRTELAGRDLACWCPLTDADGTPVPCHADVLLVLANTPAPPR